MSFLEFVKFHSKILVRSALAVTIAFVCVWEFVGYRDQSTRIDTLESLNNSIVELSNHIAPLKNGKEFRQLVESGENNAINSFLFNPKASDQQELLRILAGPSQEQFKVDVKLLNTKLKSVTKYYEKTFELLAEKRYRQRHPIKEIYYAYVDKLPIKEDLALNFINSELETISNYREYLLDSSVRQSYKRKADGYIGKAINNLIQLQRQLASSGETAINAYWNSNLTVLRPKLLTVASNSYLELTRVQKKRFYTTVSKLTMLFVMGVVLLLALKNEKEYGLLKERTNKIKEMKSKMKFNNLKDDMLAAFKDAEDLPLALLNRKEHIIWANKGFDQLLRSGLDKERNWENIRRRSIISTSTKTGLNNSIKIKGKGNEDYILKSHPFISENKEFRIIKLTEVNSYFLDSSESMKSPYARKNSFNPFELVEDIVERLGSWSSVYDFKIADSKSLPAFYNMDPELLRQEMGSLVASLMYFSKANDYRPKVVFDIDTSGDGFSFKMQLKNMHLKAEEIGTSIEVSGKRYVPLLDSFAKIEETLQTVDGKVLVKNYTSSKGQKNSEVQLIVKENFVQKTNHAIDFVDRGERL